MEHHDFLTLLQARQTILPKRLGAPGPDSAQLMSILGAAAHAPDHDRVLPWRFVLIGQEARAALADAFAHALIARDPSAQPEHIAQAREKAYRAPTLLALVVDDGAIPIPPIPIPTGAATVDKAPVPWQERVLSAGCAVQNVLLMATALGWGSALTSGQALHGAALRALFGLSPSQQVLCFISLGTVQSRKAARVRPCAADYVTALVPGQGMVAYQPPIF